MNELLTFDVIKRDVENAYPAPIARVFRKYRILSEGDLGGRHKDLIDLYEILVKFLCVVLLQEARRLLPDLRHRLPQGEKSLYFLKHPPLGGWVGLLRTLNHLDLGSAESHWFQYISQWYFQKKTSENTAILHLFDQITGINYDTRTRTPHAEICNAFVTYRNRQFAHAANIHEAELLKRLPILEHLLCYMLHSMDFLKDMQIFYTDRIELTPNNNWRVHDLRLVGINEEPSVFTSSHKLELSELYLVPAENNSIESTPVRLGPFFIRQMNEALKKPEVYLYNDAWRTKLEYISYASGTYYYHKELHSDFSELLELKLRPGAEEDTHRHLSLEERSEHAETAFKRAMFFLEKQQLEDALDSLELSAELERRPQTFLEIARIQNMLGDPNDAILQSLQNCLELDPSHSEAFHFQQTLLHRETEISSPSELIEEQNSLPRHERYPMFFHLFTPPSLRPYAPFFLIAFLVVWYSLSAAIEYLTGHADKTLLNLLQFCLGTLIILCVTVGRNLFLRLRIPLSLQLDSMRLERFEQWFQQQYSFIFGRITFENNGYIYHKNNLYEKLFLYTSGLIIVLAGIIGYILCELYKVPLFFMLKRWLDNMLVVVLLGFVLVRYIIPSTIFIYKFSQLSLKPMLTKINDDGFRAFAPLIVSNLLFVTAGFLTYLVLAYNEFTHPVRLDFILLFLGGIFFLFWSLGMPITLRIAAREAKSKAIITYAQHIEKAFKDFLDAPDEEKLTTYSWLLKHQKVIRNIPTWPLSWKATIFVVVGSNLVMLLTTLWYILDRLGYWQNGMAWLVGK